jgi:hypothetical protein
MSSSARILYRIWMGDWEGGGGVIGFVDEALRRTAGPRLALTLRLWHVRQGLLARGTPPAVVLLELQPHAMARHGYEGGALRLLNSMVAWGYSDVSHSG